MHYLDLTHPDDRNDKVLPAQALLSGQIPSCHIEKQYFHRNGAVVWANLTATTVRNESGTPLYALRMVQDVMAERQTKQAEAQQRTLAEALRNATVALNSTLDLANLLELILREVGRVVPHEAASLMLIEGSQAKVKRSWS